MKNKIQTSTVEAEVVAKLMSIRNNNFATMLMKKCKQYIQFMKQNQKEIYKNMTKKR
jgi:HD superfamily phosphohydrolase YqeK